MEKENNDRKRFLSDYLNELFETLTSIEEEVEKKTKELEQLSKRSKELFDEMSMVKKLYDKLVPESENIINPQMNALSRLAYEYNINKPQSVVEALKTIFNFSPTKEFEPVELKDELESLRRKNLLNSDAENLLWITHSALKTLLREKYIIKNTSSNKPTYHKNSSISEMLKELIG